MRNRIIAATLLTAATAAAGVTMVIAQQKPVSSRPSIVVYKSPT